MLMIHEHNFNNKENSNHPITPFHKWLILTALVNISFRLCPTLNVANHLENAAFCKCRYKI